MISLSRYISRILLCLAAIVASLPGVAHAQAMQFVMENFPPFIVADKDEGSGPFPEIVRAICASIKVECVLKVLPWRRAYAMAEQGTVDGIFVLARTPEREKLFHYTDDVLRSSSVVFTRDPGFAYTQAKDLAGMTIATYGPSAVSQHVQQLVTVVPTVRQEMEVDNRIVLRKLHAGRYAEPAAAVVNREVGLQIIKEENLAGLRIAGQFRQISYAIGLSRKRVSKEQAERFNAALRELVKQGTVKDIADKYGVKAAR